MSLFTALFGMLIFQRYGVQIMIGFINSFVDYFEYALHIKWVNNTTIDSNTMSNRSFHSGGGHKRKEGCAKDEIDRSSINVSLTCHIKCILILSM